MKLHYFKLILTVMILGCPAAATLGAISLTQAVDRTEMAFEDSLLFQITVSWPGPIHAYRFDKPFRLQADRLKVARFSSTVSSSGMGPDEVTTKVFNYVLEPVLSGSGRIEPLVVAYLSWPDSTTGELSTDPVALSIADPVPKIAVSAEDSPLWAWIGGGMVLLGVALLYFRFRTKGPAVVDHTPAETFLVNLESLKKEAGMDLKKFQTGLYKHLIEFIAKKYDVEIDRLATDAAVRHLEEKESNESVCSTLSGWLARAEREKFSPVASAPGEVSRLEAEVREFFEKLK